MLYIHFFFFHFSFCFLHSLKLFQTLEYGNNKLLYIPYDHEFGKDELKYVVNDCPYERQRASEEAIVDIWIEPVDDPPIAKDFVVKHKVFFVFDEIIIFKKGGVKY